MTPLRRFANNPASSLYSLAAIRKRIKAREQEVIHLPEVIAMQSSAIQPSRIIELTDPKSQERFARYGIFNTTPPEAPEPKHFCLFCRAPDDTTKDCTYGLSHEFVEANSTKVPPVEELCIRCGLHPRNPAAAINGCNHRTKKEEPKEIKPKETKVEETKGKPKRKKMKRWPDAHLPLAYQQIVKPIKEALEKGYRIIRRPDVKEVEYEGYNIGKHELSVLPSPKLRLTKDYLEYEQKAGNTLADVLLNILFLLGIEQGRRAERQFNAHIDHLIATLKAYRDTNKDLRRRVDELEAYIEVKANYPNIREHQVKPMVEMLVNDRRPIRLAALQKELEADPTAVGSIKRPVRTRWSHVLGVSNIISAETTKEQWKAYLNEVGWTYADWKRVAKKKNVRTLKFKDANGVRPDNRNKDPKTDPPQASLPIQGSEPIAPNDPKRKEGSGTA